MRIRKILVAVDPALPHGGTLRTAVQLATAAEAQIAVPWRDPQGVPAVEIVRAADRERADLIGQAMKFWYDQVGVYTLWNQQEPQVLVRASIKNVPGQSRTAYWNSQEWDLV